MDKSELWLMRDNFYKIGHRQNEPSIKTACKPPILLKPIQIKLTKNMSLLY